MTGRKVCDRQLVFYLTKGTISASVRIMADTKPQETKTAKKTLFEHGASPVFVLVPHDELDRRMCLEHLDPLFEEVAEKPRVVADLRVGRLPSNAVLYVCHPSGARKRGTDGKYRDDVEAFVSEPIEVKRFSQAFHDEDGLGAVNVPAIVDAIQQVCKNTRSGRFYRVQLGGDKEIANMTAKLLDG